MKWTQTRIVLSSFFKRYPTANDFDNIDLSYQIVNKGLRYSA